MLLSNFSLGTCGLTFFFEQISIKRFFKVIVTKLSFKQKVWNVSHCIYNSEGGAVFIAINITDISFLTVVFYLNCIIKSALTH